MKRLFQLRMKYNHGVYFEYKSLPNNFLNNYSKACYEFTQQTNYPYINIYYPLVAVLVCLKSYYHLEQMELTRYPFTLYTLIYEANEYSRKLKESKVTGMI